MQQANAVKHETTFAIIKDAQLVLTVADDKMSARLEVTAPYGGKIPSTSEAITFCHEKLVTRGISRKRIEALLERAATLSTGKSISEVIAKGLPIKEGKPITAKPGKSIPLKLEDGVRINQRDTNLVIADRDGMPKFDGFKVGVDEVFVSNRVNVGTGNIDYRGAVIINGDVADKMKVIAKGDIIITQGAAGQTVDNNTVPNCVIRAGGNVCIENAQGLDIICGGDLIVRKQLAFSRIVCKRSIFVSKQDKADGILIGCQISGRGEITAGVIGATSGSSISIDFTQEYNNVHRASTSLKKQYEGLQSTYTQHQQQQQFAQHLTIKATHTLHSGVYVIINKYTWESKQQFGPSKVFFVTSKWEITPLV